MRAIELVRDRESLEPTRFARPFLALAGAWPSHADSGTYGTSFAPHAVVMTDGSWTRGLGDRVSLSDVAEGRTLFGRGRCEGQDRSARPAAFESRRSQGVVGDRDVARQRIDGSRLRGARILELNQLSRGPSRS